MRSELLYLRDAIEHTRKVLQYIGGIDIDALPSDPMRMDAVLRNLQIVGESIKKLPDEMRSSEPQIPWPSIAAMRNLLVHHYFRIDSDIVLDICKNHLSPLLEALERMSEKYAD